MEGRVEFRVIITDSQSELLRPRLRALRFNVTYQLEPFFEF